MRMDNEYIGNLTAEKLDQIIDNCD
jgi:hypothetical protein